MFPVFVLPVERCLSRDSPLAPLSSFFSPSMARYSDIAPFFVFTPPFPGIKGGVLQDAPLDAPPVLF